MGTEHHSSYFVIFNVPTTIAVAATGALIMYLADARVGNIGKQNLAIALSLSLTWVVLSASILWRTPRTTPTIDAQIITTAILLLIFILGISVLGLRLRLLYAFAVSLFITSIWFILSWFRATAR